MAISIKLENITNERLNLRYNGNDYPFNPKEIVSLEDMMAVKFLSETYPNFLKLAGAEEVLVKPIKPLKGKDKNESRSV